MSRVITNKVLQPKQVKSAELRWASENGGETWPLMEKAAVSFVRQYLPQLEGNRLLVLVGAGNNGGDGYRIASLMQEAGLELKVVAPFGLPAETIDAFRAMSLFLETGGEVLTELPNSSYSIVIDALFGAGLYRSLSDTYALFISKINDMNLPVYSVDVPSGLSSKSGLVMPVAIKATATHCFIAYKPGLLTNDGPSHCGHLSIDTLGLETQSDFIFEPSYSLPTRIGSTHKSQHGNVRVIGGQEHMAGAAIISARAALHAGAGRVFLHCNEAFFPSALAVNPEIMVCAKLTAESLSTDVCVFGPGLGRGNRASEIYRLVVDSGACGVLDADALHLLASSNRTACNWVLTPHEGEAAVLLGLSPQQVHEDRAAAALALAKRYESVVVLKGAGTIVARGDKLVFTHSGSAAMATPGMGDCLAGMIGSLMAQGLSPVDAAVSGVNWHATAGALLAATQRVVFATDIIEALRFG